MRHNPSDLSAAYEILLEALDSEIEWVNALGRTNFGEGLLKLQTYEVADLLLPDPRPLSPRAAQVWLQAAGLCGPEGHDRASADEQVNAVVLLDSQETASITAHLQDLIAHRLTKANIP